MRNLLPLLGLLACLSAHAQTRDDMLQWKKDFLDKHEKVSYFDADGKPMTEAEFIDRIVAQHPGLHWDRDGNSLAVRLMSMEETAKAQAALQKK